jgi:hypothetical protein
MMNDTVFDNILIFVGIPDVVAMAQIQIINTFKKSATLGAAVNLKTNFLAVCHHKHFSIAVDEGVVIFIMPENGFIAHTVIAIHSVCARTPVTLVVG